MLPGVYLAKRANGTIFYRASFTYQNKHISLGSFQTEELAHQAYLEARLLTSSKADISSYSSANSVLSFEKWVVLINFRDNQMYFKTPIYLYPKYFIYYLDSHTELKFDVDDLFYYANHKIMRRKGHLFVADYGMQVTILSRYGIKNHAVAGKDYVFINGDSYDFRYNNIQIINRYYGVSRELHSARNIYIAKIHIRGDYIIGRYSSETDAAIAYNKAADILRANGCPKNYAHNYIENFSATEYTTAYNRIKISSNILQMTF